MRSSARIALLVLISATVTASPALGAAPTCANTPLPEKLTAADAAFVGRLVSSRPVADGRYYRFVVDQPVKGPIGRQVDVRAGELTDSEGTALKLDVAVGVLARLDGAALVTDSCSLTDAGALLVSFDEPRGNAIKVAIGLVILALVVVYALRRRRRGTRPTLPRPSRSE